MTFATRAMIVVTLSVLCAGAAYLMITRGPAIMIDLSGSLSQLFCV